MSDVTSTRTSLPSAKDWGNLSARAALAGYELYRSIDVDGRVVYFACRWGLTRALGDLDQVERFLAQAGA